MDPPATCAKKPWTCAVVLSRCCPRNIVNLGNAANYRRWICEARGSAELATRSRLPLPGSYPAVLFTRH
jgi:hypothetical protein